MHEFRLTDAAGQPHLYEIDLHRGSEGLRLSLQLGSLLVEPLAAAVGPMLPGMIEAAVKGGKLDKQALAASLLDDPDTLRSLDLSGVGRAVQQAALSLPDETVYAVLRYTNRDGKPLVASGRATLDFDAAYQGNYGELLRAVWEVARANGFFPGLGTWLDGAKKAREAAPAPRASVA